MARHLQRISLLLGVLASRSLCAEGRPVVPPIDLPHSYYYREMYLPQLTSGPSSVAWAPDSREVVFSMAGSLWRQKIDSTSAEQLTDGAGYDYQPDWSPDGRYIVYASAQGEAIELWLLELSSGRTRQLTQGGAVNVEPRWSPEGGRVLYVSSAYHRHFHVFAAEVREGQLTHPVRLTGENKSSLPRYYYSAYDHEINPTWTRDGEAIVFVSNRGRIHGTGGLWRAAAVPGAQALELRYEETNWQARPDFSPDGKRIVYSSYLGRNWLQLWLMPADGGEPLPLTYGEWDETSPRWSPDGAHIAFISNRDGDTQLRLLRLPGGSARVLEATHRQRLRPSGSVHLSVRDEHGLPTPARVVVTDASGRFCAPAHAWTHHAEFDRNQHPFEARYFHTAGEDLIEVPAGAVSVEVMKGLARQPERHTLEVRAGATADVAAVMPAHPWLDGTDRRWVSADVHVHMNYGGHFRNTPAHLVLQAQAEDLDIVENLIVNKEQRFPDIAYSGVGVDPASKPGTLVVHGQEFHTSYWGHLGVLGMHGNTLLPGYAGYPSTAAASLFPTNADVADLAHAQGALVGYVHPFDAKPDPADTTQPLTYELPVDVALGKVDYIEVMGYSDHLITSEIWYRLLNCGFRLPAGAGTDAFPNFASLRGPPGLVRVFVQAGARLDARAFLAGLKAGRTFVSNAPLLEFTLDGRQVGAEIRLPRGGGTLTARGRLRSSVPVDHLEIVGNGRVVAAIPLTGDRTQASATVPIAVAGSGWYVVRAYADRAELPVLDRYPFGSTSPVYVRVGNEPVRSPEDAEFFMRWIDRLDEAAQAHQGWNTAAEREHVLRLLAEARGVYAGRP